MYQIIIKESALKQMKKLDPSMNRIIKNWIVKNLLDTDNPRLHGKALTGNLKGIWRYRVGDYRIFADIQEDILTIFIFEVAHRRDVYKNKETKKD